MDTMVVLLFACLTTTATLLIHSVNGQGCKRRVCYFNDDANKRRNKKTRFLPEDIDPTLCSHIIYNRVVLSGNDVVPTEYYGDSSGSTAGIYERVLRLKETEKNLKVLLTVDGYLCNDELFFKMSGNETSRSEFIDNIIKYLRKHKFDGFNLRCVFTGEYEVGNEIKQALSNLIADVREAFDEEGANSNRLLFTLDVYGERIVDDTCYAIPHISQNVNWINFLAYDLHGFWHHTTGHSSPLFAEPSKGQLFSMDRAVQHWRRKGLPKVKVVIGMPSFGASYTLTTSRTDDGAPATIGGHGRYTRQNGLLAYYETCGFIQDHGTALHRLTHQRVPYLVSGKQWVSYEDIDSVSAKISYLKKRGLGGFVISTLHLDDFKGAFCKQGPYPLLKAANNECGK